MGRRKKFFEEQTIIKKKPHPERLVLVTRSEWNAKESKEPLPPVPVPVQYVVLTWTDTEICEWPGACKKTIKQVQTDHMDNLGLPDIRYNFLVGPDKQMYEGRGWDMAGPTYPETIRGANELNGKSIEIAFINKNMTEPIPDDCDTLCKFLAKEYGLNKLVKPVYFKGILNNKFVPFRKIFQGEIVHEFMMDDDDRAEAAERSRLSDEIVKEMEPIFAARKAEYDKLMEETLAAQKAQIESKTPEQIKAEYGYTSFNVNYDRIKEIEDIWQKEGEPKWEDETPSPEVG